MSKKIIRPYFLDRIKNRETGKYEFYITDSRGKKVKISKKVIYINIFKRIVRTGFFIVEPMCFIIDKKLEIIGTQMVLYVLLKIGINPFSGEFNSGVYMNDLC